MMKLSLIFSFLHFQCSVGVVVNVSKHRASLPTVSSASCIQYLRKLNSEDIKLKNYTIKQYR